jgi:hypothetical protein
MAVVGAQDAGDIAENVDSPESFEDAPDSAIYRRFVADVAVDVHRRPSERFDESQGLGEAGAIDVQAGDAPAFIRQADGSRAADARCGSGNEGDLVREAFQGFGWLRRATGGGTKK